MRQLRGRPRSSGYKSSHILAAHISASATRHELHLVRACNCPIGCGPLLETVTPQSDATPTARSEGPAGTRQPLGHAAGVGMANIREMGERLRYEHVSTQRLNLLKGLSDSDVIYLNVLGKSLVILNSAQAAHDLLERRSNIYSDRCVCINQNTATSNEYPEIMDSTAQLCPWSRTQSCEYPCKILGTAPLSHL